jgi:hypothetical protein
MCEETKGLRLYAPCNAEAFTQGIREEMKGQHGDTI